MGMGGLFAQNPEAIVPMLAQAGIEPPAPEQIQPASYNPFSPPANSGLGRAAPQPMPVLRPSVPMSEAPPGSVPNMGMGEMTLPPAPGGPQPGTPMPAMGGPGAYEGSDSPFAPMPMNVPLPMPRPTMGVPGSPAPAGGEEVPLPRPRPAEAGATDVSAQAQQPGSELQKMASALAGVKMPEAPGIQRISSPPPYRPAAISTGNNTQLIQNALTKQDPLALLRLAQAIQGGR